MAFSESETKVLAALTIQSSDQTVDELCAKTLLPARAVRKMLKMLAYDGQVTNRPFGWRITPLGRRSVAGPGYRDTVAEIRSAMTGRR
jgi:DNA-binding IclR family transcriptional regulator